MARIIKDSWIREYLRYTQGQESPDVFHLWVAFSIIAATLERNVWLDRGYFNTYPNLYTILIAGSAVCRKSVAISIGVNLFRQLEPKPFIISEKVTPEKLIEDLSINTINRGGRAAIPWGSALVVASELSVFLSKSATMGGMLELLTHMWDTPKDGDIFSYSTRKDGLIEVYNLCLNILGGSTPEWLKITIPAEAIGGGFMARTIFVYASKPRPPIAFPKKSSREKHMEMCLVEDLHRIRELRGSFKLTKDAEEWFEAWYKQEIPRIHTSSLGEFVARKPEMLLKIAMICSAAEDDSMRITPEHLAIGRNALDDVQRNLPYVIDPLITKEQSLPDLASDVVKVLDRLGGSANLTTIQKRLWRKGSSAAVSMALDTLLSAGLIKETKSIAGVRGTRMYTLVSQFDDIVQQVIEKDKEDSEKLS